MSREAIAAARATLEEAGNQLEAAIAHSPPELVAELTDANLNAGHARARVANAEAMLDNLEANQARHRMPPAGRSMPEGRT